MTIAASRFVQRNRAPIDDIARGHKKKLDIPTA
jgi:hypothetical protein